MNNYQSGHFAEIAVLFYLFCKGYKKVALNYKPHNRLGAGEIDLIVKKGKILVFVEVKKRTTFEKAAYSITEKQQLRIRRGAEYFLQNNPCYSDCDLRFDAVLVKFPFSLIHIFDAF